MANKPYHAGNHRALGGVVVRQAYANPDTICARCGKTYRQAVEPWTSIGMLRFAQMREDGAVRDAWDDDED